MLLDVITFYCCNRKTGFMTTSSRGTRPESNRSAEGKWELRVHAFDWSPLKVEPEAKTFQEVYLASDPRKE